MKEIETEFTIQFWERIRESLTSTLKDKGVISLEKFAGRIIFYLEDESEITKAGLEALLATLEEEALNTVDLVFVKKKIPDVLGVKRISGQDDVITVSCFKEKEAEIITFITQRGWKLKVTKPL